MTSEKAKTTILNVDDDDVARYAISRILRKNGFEVLEAVSGAEALRLVKQAPDLILLDVNLSDMSGFEVCRLIKEDPSTALIPVLHLSATYMDDRSRVKGLDTGADGYLTYPLEPPVLIAYVKSLLRIGQTERKLEEAARKWRTTFDAMKEAVFLVDAEQRLTQCNKSMKGFVGKPFSEIIGRTCYNVVHGSSEPIEGCPFMRMRETLRRETLVLPIGERWFDIATDPLLDGDGTLIGAIHIMADVTERKQADEALRENEEKYRSLVESTEDSIYLVDRECRYLFMNQKHLSRFDLTLDEVIGKSYGEFHSKKETNEFAGNVNEVFETGTSLSYEYKSERDNGYFLRTLSPVKGLDGTMTAVTVDSKDITEHKQAEEEKKKLEAQFQTAQRMEAIGTLAGGIAHDFNNILMGIQGNASLVLLDKTSTHPDYERLKNIEQGVLSGAELTRQLLGFAMGGKYEVKPTDLNELIKRSSQMFGRTKKEITIHRKYHKGIWPVEVDQGQIEQVLLNLYVNAWQAMPGGGDLYIQTENTTLNEDYVKPFNMEPGRYVEISLTDTGVGMDEATQQRIFEPFFTTKEMGRGTGLGLASVYGIIKNHGGIITVDSIKGEGSTFTMYLPASEKEVIKEEELPEAIIKGTETVLLVDDEDMIIDVGEEILKELGYTVFLARGGKEAIELYKKNKDKIDIVILDMIMPGVGGGETYDRLKEINPRIRVLLSSGYSIDGQATEILERGCDGFIQKPFSMKKLSKAIRKILES